MVQQHPVHLGNQVLYVDFLGFEGFHYSLGLEWTNQHGATVDIAGYIVYFNIPG